MSDVQPHENENGNTEVPLLLTVFPRSALYGLPSLVYMSFLYSAGV